MSVEEVDGVIDEGLGGADDDVVAAAAPGDGRMLLKLAVDLADTGRFPPGGHPGIVAIRVPDPRSSLIVVALNDLPAEHSLDDFVGAIVIAQLDAVRIRRPSVREQ
jgi:hypothetical protein